MLKHRGFVFHIQIQIYLYFTYKGQVSVSVTLALLQESHMLSVRLGCPLEIRVTLCRITECRQGSR